jgi:hypothetical protein
MRRRDFVLTSGSAILTGLATSNLHKPAVGINFELSTSDKDPSEVNSILVGFETIEITPQHLNENKNMKVQAKIEVTNQTKTSDELQTSVKNGTTKQLANDINPIVIDGINTDDLIRGTLTVIIDHPDISKKYSKRFTISDSEISQNGQYHYYGNDSGSLRYNTLTTLFEIGSDGFSYRSSSNFTDGQLILNRDGTKGLFKEDNTDNISEISFSTPFDLSTASTVRSKTHSGDQRGGICAYGSNLDKLLYSSGGKSGNEVYEYSLNDTFDLSKFTLDETHSMPEDTSWGNWFSNNGNKWYSASVSNNEFYQFNLSTPFDLSSVDSTESMSDGVEDSSSAIVTGENGDVLYTFHHSPQNILRYDLKTPYDITTATNRQDFGEEFEQDVGQYIHAPPWY